MTSVYSDLGFWFMARLRMLYGAGLPLIFVPIMAASYRHPERYRRAADIVDKVLRGIKPSDIPVEQPTTFELAVNLKTAKAIRLTFPPAFLARADVVIE